MVKLIEPKDTGELALMKSLLDGNNIPYFVQNEHFGSLYGGATSVVMVHDSDFDRAGALVRELLKEDDGRDSEAPRPGR
ncbi:MAG: DUF2007 domain-containing protein [Nitrospiraceae bacterium]